MSRKPLSVDGYKHHGRDRPNLPTDQTSPYMRDEDRRPTEYRPPVRFRDGPVLAWDRDRDLDSESTPATPLYIREKIHPAAFAESLESRDAAQTDLDLFGFYDGLPKGASYEWYRHRGHWQNRLINGESRHVMASLLKKESMAGNVQMIYFDPPFGISFRSNMQANARSRNVKDGPGGQPNDPPHLRAFRDSYKNGIHSYLDNIYRMAIHARALLTESGSLFMQIGSANVHRAAIVLDEVFGAENRVATISFAKSGATSAGTLSQVADYLLWYANDKENMRYQQLYEPLSTRKEVLDYMSYAAKIETGSGANRNLTGTEKTDPDREIPEDSRLYTQTQLTSQQESSTGLSEPYVYDGRKFPCPPGRHWSVSTKGLDRLAELGRLDGDGRSLRCKIYEDEIPGRKINNIWGKQMSADDLHYVVETAESVVERCILMTTNPGDLVMDPTCGSGTTAFVAEKWGRRWITSDSSVVAISLARQRLAVAVFDYYLLRDSSEGAKAPEPGAVGRLGKNKARRTVGQGEFDYGHDPAVGFVYETKETVSVATLAYNKSATKIKLVNKPRIKPSTIRVSSPFTVESHSPYRFVDPESALSESERSAHLGSTHVKAIVHALGVSGIWSGNATMAVDDVTEHSQKSSLLITHTARVNGEKSAIMIAPDDCTVPLELIDRAAEEVVRMRDVKNLIVIAFAFEAGMCAGGLEERGWLTIHKVQANLDLRIGNLTDVDDYRALVLLGEPDIVVRPDLEDKGKITVEIAGYDTYDPKTRQLKRGDAKEIICWMIDTDYDGRSFFARRIHFPNGGGDRQIQKFNDKLEQRLDTRLWDSTLAYKSFPFPRPKGKRIAVRMITETHTEMMAVEYIGEPPAGKDPPSGSRGALDRARGG